jgi:oligoribonuclease (3'-5' exoribonuclease)
MEIKTTHIIIALGVVAVLSQGENVRSSVEKQNQERTQRTEFSDRIRQSRLEEREAEQLSKVALARYKTNCVLVVDQSTGK